MTPISFATTPPAGAPAAADSKSKATVDYESFLKLLVAQMKNQDPTAPMESTDYVAQLATFSQVEQSIQMNTKLDSMLQFSAFAQADSLIGRTIESADGKTSGTIKEVKLTAEGVTAILEEGGEIAVGPGVVLGGSDE